jgi:serine/threonine-protein kinase
MAEVFLAKQHGHSGFTKLVVIKQILQHHAQDREFTSMFLSEARTAADLRHPNVVNVFEVGEEADGSLFMAMEFLHGKDVRQVTRKLAERDEMMPLGIAAQIVIDAARGLHYAHTKKDLAGKSLDIVHRDVSPQNLIITFDGNTKLVDFGIAKASSHDNETASGVIKGKYTYMSPEQAEGFDVDTRSDQFALGIMLWELLTMRRLFKRDTEMQTLRAIANDEIPPPSTFNAEVSEVLDEIVLTCLRRDPEDRYDTCQYLAEDLEECMAEEGIIHSPARLGSWMNKIFEGEVEPEASLHESLIPSDNEASAPTMTTPAPLDSTEATAAATPRALATTPDPGRRTVLAAGAVLAVAFASALGWMLWQGRAPQAGTVVIRTQPAGATVFVDDEDRGRSPVELTDVPAGASHRLRLELEGHETALAAFTLAAGQPRLELDYPLTEKKPPVVEPTVPPPPVVSPDKPIRKPPRKPPAKIARLRVKVKPWGDVFIDGKFVGQTPLAAQKLPPGKHSIRVRNNDSGREKTRTVTLDAGADQLVRFDLRR